MRCLFAAVVASLIGLAQATTIPPDAYRHRALLTREAQAVWGLDAPTATFAAQIHQESRWRTNAISPVGAAGMAQFMPATSRWIARIDPALVRNAPLTPAWAIRALVVYDHHLYQRIRARDDCQRMAMTLSAYNGGLGWLIRDKQKAIQAGADPGIWFDSIERFNAGRSPPAFTENRGYPRLILHRYQARYINAGFGRGVCT